MKKRLLSLALALAMCLSLTAPALAGSPPTEEEAKTYFSLTRNGEDELADKFLTGKKVTLVNELTSPAESWEDYYRVISASDSWKITHTGSDDCTIWVSLNTYVLDDEGDGQYSLEGHDAWRENESETEGVFFDSAFVDGENGYYVVNLTPGKSISFSTADFLNKGIYSGELLDHGEGHYVYELGVNMEFAGTGEDDKSWATYSIYLMLDEDAVADIKNGNTPSTPTEPDESSAPSITAAGTSDGVIVVTLTNGTFDAVEGAKTSSWSVRTNRSYEISAVELNSDRTKATLTLTGPVTGDWAQVSVATSAIADFYSPDLAISCTATITSGGSETITIKPTVTATPSTFDVGTTEVKVTLKSADASFALHLDREMFGIESGTTRLALVSVAPARNPGSDGRVWCDAVLTFSNITAAVGGAASGELKITAKRNAFASPDAATVIEDAAPVTITIGSSSSGGSNPPVIPDEPVVPSNPSTGNSGGSGSTTTRPSTSPDTVTNPDGSTTTTKTDKATGTVTETTKTADGSETVVETRTDGTVTTTATDAAGNRTATVENPDGSAVTTIENRDGGVSTTTVSASGQVTAVVTAPAAAVAAAQSGGQAVALPMPEVPLTASAAAAPVVTVTTGSSQPVKVEIPVERTTPGTVAVIVNADGTETVVRTSLAVGSGVTLAVPDGATVKIVDNSRNFADTAAHWAKDAITFAAAHELFNGTGTDSFTPDGTMTRGMLVTVLARYDGVDTSAGTVWYEKGAEWAAANGVSSGADLDAPVSREQLATMLYRYAASSGMSTAAAGALTGFTDAGSVSGYASDAMAWAVGAGLISGNPDGTLAPRDSATRGEVAAILMRFCENVMK